MVNIKELMQFDSLNIFTKEELSKLASIAGLHIFSKGKKIFKQNSYISNLYLMVSGEISLTYEVNSDITLIISTIKPGIFFGISSLCHIKTPHNAYCYQPSEVLLFPIQELKNIFIEYKDFGYKFLYYLLKFYHNITKSKTEDILKYFNQKRYIHQHLKDLSFLDFSI